MCVCYSVCADWCSKEVGLEALQELAGMELAQEIGGTLNIRRLTKLKSRSMTLHLPLRVCEG